MDTVDIVLTLPESLVENARQLGLLSSDEVARLITLEIQRLDDALETQWEQSLDNQPFARAFAADGNVDFEALRSTSDVVSLDDPNSSP
jgi:hypothetical protein